MTINNGLLRLFPYQMYIILDFDTFTFLTAKSYKSISTQLIKH